MNWEGIEGWFDYKGFYDEQVRRAKDGAVFVEVGAWKGRSTAYLAQAIKDSGKRIELHVVDNWGNTEVTPENGPAVGGAYGSPDVCAEFHRNMIACGVRDMMHVHERDAAEAALLFNDESVDFVFIDGDHRADYVYRDCAAWWPKVKPGGLLSGHDYDEKGPQDGARAFAENTGCAIYGDGIFVHGLRCFGIPKPSTNEYSILLGLPHYDGTVTATSAVVACTRQYTGKGSVSVREHGASALCSNFNNLLCSALNGDFTHFTMLHADIIPQEYWLDVLMREMEQEQAQLVCAIAPIKDMRGMTSTGIALKEHNWTPKRRFTMHELMDMPSTFDAERAGYPGEHLVLNTGCWIADLRDPRWLTCDKDGRLVAHFEMNDMITNLGGKRVNYFEPEDFYFSRVVQELGMRAVATRKPGVTHIGNFGFQNMAPWGTHKQDEDTRQYWDYAQTTTNDPGSAAGGAG